VLFNTTGDNGENEASWRAFYTVVAQSNLVIYNVNSYAGDGVSSQVKKMAIAEARFMRALAYRFLVMNWGAVPIIEDNLAQLFDTTITRNTVPSVWRFITREMKAASLDLPETSLQEGRLTKWSAEGMLSRFYLTRSGVESNGAGARNQSFLDSAKYFSERQYEKDYDRKKMSAPGVTEFLVEKGYKGAHYDHFHNFFTAIREKKLSVEDALFGYRAAAPALLCNDSYFTNRAVVWDPVKLKVIS
jgi:hypothetical protein